MALAHRCLETEPARLQVRKYYPNSPIYLLQDGGNVDFGPLCKEKEPPGGCQVAFFFFVGWAGLSVCVLQPLHAPAV